MTGVKRELGFWSAVSLVVGGMIGSGVFTLPGSLARFGGLSLAGWVVSASGSILLALSFVHLARRHPAAGGVYAYARDSFGDLAGFIVAWGYWISVWSANAALSLSFVGYLDPFIPSVVRNPRSMVALAISVLWLLTFVNSRGVRTAGRVQVVTTALKLLPLVVIGIGGLMWFEPSHFAVPDAYATGGAAGGALINVVTLTLFAFVGLEAATIPAGAVVNPDRTIPRATIIGTLVAASIYIVSTTGVMSLVAPGALTQSTAPFADAARNLGGDGLAIAVAIGAAISSFGALNGWILIVGQLPMAVAQDGVFPAVFARINSRGTPVAGMVIGGLLSSGLILLNATNSAGLVDLFTQIIVLSTLATLLPYTFCSLAVFLPGGRRAPNLPRSTGVIAALAFVYAMFAIAGAGHREVFLGFLLVIGGLPVYVWQQTRAEGRGQRAAGGQREEVKGGSA